MKTVFYHTAAWCTPCKRMKPLAKKVTNDLGATFVEVNVDEQQPVLPEITGIPTVVIYGEGSGEPTAILGPQQLTPTSLRKALA